MNNKVGDKVLYDGEVHTVIQVPDERPSNEVGWLHEDYVVLDLHYEHAIHYTEIELYFTPHERLLKLGWEMWDTDGVYKTYGKFDDKRTRRTMSIKINKDKGGWHFKATYSTHIDKELTAVLLEYLEDLENNKNKLTIKHDLRLCFFCTQFCYKCTTIIGWNQMPTV